MDFSKHTDKFSVKVNKIPLGQVTYYRATRGTWVSASTRYYTVEIKRRIPNNPERELFNFHTHDNFNVTFIRAASRITYVDCVVEKVVEEIGDDRLIYETVTLAALERIVTDPNEDNPYEELE